MFGRIAGGTRRFCATATASLELPVVRLPTAVFPGHPLSLPIVEPSPHHRPMAGCLSPSFADELCESYGRVALLADGARVGVIADLPTGTSAAAPDGMMLHVIGGTRVTFQEVLERTPRGGGRLARLAPFDDDALDTSDARALEGEAAAARALLESRQHLPVQPDDWELLLCTLDEEVDILPPHLDPTAHPQWLDAARIPEGAAALSHWLAARLPLTTSLRLHLLACPCPLKRMRDLVDSMRLLADPAGAYSKARAATRGPGGSMLKLCWHTAEASGCEIEPPRPVVDWAPAGEMGVSRY